MTKPLSPSQARSLIRGILAPGEVGFSKHALREVAADGLTAVDCVNVLRVGVVEAPEHKKGPWRHRVRSASIWVGVAFRSETQIVVVTAWRET